MKKIFIVIAVLAATACNKLPVEDKSITGTTMTDTVYIQDSSYLVKNIALQCDLVYMRDSLNAVRDTLDSVRAVFNVEHEELFVAKYKLQRIKKYCDIVKKGNNSKYLRGWILRTLNN